MATQTTTVRSAHGADYKIKTAELLAQMQAWLEDHDSLDGLLRINWASRHAAANNTSFTPIEIKVGDAWAELSVIFSREVLRLDVDAATSDGMQQQNDRKSKIFKQAVR